jgi:hypothetical protein
VAKKGDTCDKITKISPSLKSGDFQFLNPGLDENCSNIIPGYNYCVEAVGDISTYTGYGYDNSLEPNGQLSKIK